MKIETNSRLTYIDYLETIAMFCVVCCHYYSVIGTGASTNMYMLFMKCFGVPTFFLANGALMFQRKFSLRKHLKKTGMLIVTTAAWKAIYLLIQYVRLSDGSNIWKKSDLWNYFCGGKLSDPYVPAEHFWYMYALIGVYLVFPLFAAIYKENILFLFNIAVCFNVGCYRIGCNYNRYDQCKYFVFHHTRYISSICARSRSLIAISARTVDSYVFL